MKDRGVVFRLDEVTVDFRRNAIRDCSLKTAFVRLLRGESPAYHRALCRVTLAIGAGEHLGVIGRNGAGKSTLLRVLARVATPAAGRVYVNPSHRVAPLLELGIGFHPDLSGTENCHLAGALMGYSFGEIERRLPAVIAFAELEDFVEEPVKSYSSGMYARLAFALATDIEPDVLLVDEVFGVGDEFFMRKCLTRIRQLASRGTTTVFVSHGLEFLLEHCDRLLWLDAGRLVLDGPPERVAAAYRANAGHPPEESHGTHGRH